MADFDYELFNKRVTKFYQCWKAQKSTEAWGSGVSAIIVYNGSTTSESNFGGRILDLHFFGYELMDSMLAFLENKLYIVAGVKKRKQNKQTNLFTHTYTQTHKTPVLRHIHHSFV